MGRRRERRERICEEAQPIFERLGKQRQSGHDCRRGLAQQCLHQPSQSIRIALHHRRFGVARAQQAAESRVELHQHHAGRFDAALDQCRRYGAGSGPEFDDWPRRIGIDAMRHRPRQRPSGRHDCPGRQGLFQPRADKAHLVIDTCDLLRDTQRGLEHGYAEARHLAVTWLSLSCYNCVNLSKGGQDHRCRFLSVPLLRRRVPAPSRCARLPSSPSRASCTCWRCLRWRMRCCGVSRSGALSGPRLRGDERPSATISTRRIWTRAAHRHGESGRSRRVGAPGRPSPALRSSAWEGLCGPLATVAATSSIFWKVEFRSRFGETKAISAFRPGAFSHSLDPLRKSAADHLVSFDARGL